MILVRDRRTEQRHDAVTGVLIHRAFVTVYGTAQDGEEAIEDAVPGLGAGFLRKLGRAFDIGKQNGDALALALHGRARLEDAIGQMLGRVIGNAGLRLLGVRGKFGAALIAEARVERIGSLAGWTVLHV